MPLYEYSCETCGRITEALQRFADPPLATCPHCGGPLKKLFSAPSFQFKGQGWYATDYAGKTGAASAGRPESGAEKGAGEESKSAPGAAAKGAKGEAKPASGERANGAAKAEGAGGAKPSAGD